MKGKFALRAVRQILSIERAGCFAFIVFWMSCYCKCPTALPLGERSGSVVECLTRDRGAAGSSLTGVTALWSLSKTHLSWFAPGRPVPV